MDYAGTHIGLTCPMAIFRPRPTAASAALVFRAIVLALVVTGCGRPPPPPPPADVRLEVAFAGCEAVVAGVRGTACELGESRALRLVVEKAARDVVVQGAKPGPSGPTEVVLTQVRDEAPSRTVRRIDVPADVDRVIVRATTARGPGSFELPVTPARRVPWIVEAKALRAKGALAEARAIATAHTGDTAPADAAAAKGLLARIALAEGHADDAFPAFREAIAAHHAAGRISDEVDDSFALAFALHQRSHRYEEARAALDGITKLLAAYPEGRAREPYYRGILASETGDPRHALALLRRAETEAFDLDMRRLHRNARAALALELAAIGNAAQAIGVFTDLAKDPEVKGCERVEIANDLAWVMLLENESELSARESPRPFLEAALADPTCADVYVRSFALGNLARHALGAGDFAAAATHLAAARTAVTEPRGTERLAWLELEGRLLLHAKDASKALARFDEARSLARARLLLDAEWSALVGRGEALEAQGRRSDAVAAYLDAEEILDRTTLLVPLGEGRGTYVAERSRSARAAVDLLIALGKTEDAARVARRSRARVLATLDHVTRIGTLDAAARSRWESALRTYRSAREAIDADAAGDWKLPADALLRATKARRTRETSLREALEAAMSVLTGGAAATALPDERIAPGDLEIVVHPGKSDWYALVGDAKTTTSHRLDPRYTAPDVVAPSLLSPIAARIKAARRVRVRAYGRWASVDVHMLPFEGAPLLVQVAVDYPMGLRRADGTSTLERRAIVVGDPTDDLGAARREASAVARSLEGVMPHAILLGADATSRAIAAALPRAGLFHYAGHSVALPGSDGWESQMRLAANGSLTVGDLLSLSPAPRKAVLLGCDAAKTSRGGELNLAHALVAAGAEEVLAPSQPVSDVITAALAAALYAGKTRDATLDLATGGSLAQAYRLAFLQVRAETKDVDLSSYRVVAR